MKVMTLMIVLMTTLMTGCDGVPKEDTAYDAGPGMGGVFEVRLKDGTRCAVLAMPYKGGITCDWEATR
jgi:hypothetical protein